RALCVLLAFKSAKELLKLANLSPRACWDRPLSSCKCLVWDDTMVREPRRTFMLCWGCLALIACYLLVVVTIPVRVYIAEPDLVQFEALDYLLSALAFVVAVPLVLVTCLMIGGRLLHIAIEAFTTGLLFAGKLLALTA